MPHIAIYKNGDIGVVKRKKRQELSSACGALLMLHKELETCKKEGKKSPSLDIDDYDLEYSMLRKKICSTLDLEKKK